VEVVVAVFIFYFMKCKCNVFPACTAERFFRVDRAQEHLHYVMDIASDRLFILDTEPPTLPQTPEDETVFPSSATSNKQSSNSMLGEETTPELRLVRGRYPPMRLRRRSPSLQPRPRP
jgi:hypothetical protein